MGSAMQSSHNVAAQLAELARVAPGPSRWALACAAALAVACTSPDPVPAPDTSSVDQNTTGADSTVTTPDGKDIGDDNGAAKDSSDPDAAPSDGPTDAATAGETIADTAADSEPDGATDAAVETSNDADSGSKDSAPDVASTIVPGLYPATCTAAADCVNPCTTIASSCDAGKCTFKPQDKACLLDAGNGKMECMAVGGISISKPCLACQDGAKKAILSANTWLVPLDAATEGLTIKDTKTGGIMWNYSDKQAVSGGKSLWFGDPVKGNYANGKAVGATATTPKIKIPKMPNISPKLNFWLWLDTEGTAGDDLFSVSVVGEDDKATVVWTSDAIKGSTHQVWQRINVDIGVYGGQAVQIELGFATLDGTLNGFAGAFVDDLAVATGCCGADAECDDGDACTTDGCKAEGAALPVCKNVAKAACCSTNAECDDSKVCTLDLCSGPGGTCAHSVLPGCCLNDSGCDDANACTIDSCPAPGGQCQHLNKCCKSDSECATSDSCKKGICAGGQCSYTETCCILNGDCDDFNPCTNDACDKGKCIYTAATVPGCCSPQVLNSLFAGSDEGWQFKSTHPTLQFFYKAPTAATSTKSAPGALKMGDAKNDTTSAAMTNPVFKVTAVSPTITVLPGKETSLSYWVYAAPGQSTSFNQRLVIVLDGVETIVQTNPGYLMANVWKQFTLDLTPLGGKSFELNFEIMATTTFGNFTGPGVYLDDVVVSSTCQAKKCAASANCPTTGFGCLAGVCSDGLCSYANSCCTSSADCNDNSLCTSDTCNTSKKCTFTPIVGCCMGPGDCNDNNACTADNCPVAGGKCTNLNVAGCCLSSTQCNDSNNCTIDKCQANKCINEVSCCATDKDCDDGETKCTLDKCVGGKCAHTLTGVAGCCSPDVWVNDFDGGDIKDIVISNSQGPAAGWQLTNKPPAGVAKTAPGVLYYGDLNKGTFDFGASKGTATTPKILLPSGTNSKLTLDIYMDTELGGAGSFDDLYIYVVVGGNKVTAWNKSSPGFGGNQWISVTYDLKTYIGQEIQVEIFFDTKDSIGNQGKGVFIDNLKVTTGCGG